MRIKGSVADRKLESIRRLLQALGFPDRFLTNQTAVCLLALSDGRKRDGLLAGKHTLAEGARIHDILEFARGDLGIRVAENTRESYRKTSLKPLYEAGLITRHQLSTNDPNTFYRLHPDLYTALSAPQIPLDQTTLDRLRGRTPLGQKRGRGTGEEIRLRVAPGKYFVLSGGEHNELEQGIVERFGPKFLSLPRVVFVGDAARKAGYQDREAMRELNLPIKVAANLPDVILMSPSTKVMVVAEAVVSTGILNESRLEQLGELTSASTRLGFKVEFLTAFPTRTLLRRFVDQIAWGTVVWIASEPNNLILFQKRLPGSKSE